MKQNQNVKISVIIPIYNKEEFLRECLDSVLSQTLKELEVLAIDDGSTDQSAAILHRYMMQDSRIRYVKQENQGAAVARNHGLRLATGTYIAFMDPDDFYPDAGTLELLYIAAQRHQVVICGGSLSTVYPDRIVDTYQDDLTYGNTFHRAGKMTFEEYQFDFGYQRFIFQRKFLQENKLYFPLYRRFQDPPFMIRAMLLAKEFYAVQDVTYRYRWGHQEKMWFWNEEKFCDMLQGIRDDLQLSAEYHLPRLHAVMVRRLEEWDYHRAIIRVLAEGRLEILGLVLAVFHAIDARLLEGDEVLRARLQDGVYQWTVFSEVMKRLIAPHETMEKCVPSDQNHVFWGINGEHALRMRQKLRKIIRTGDIFIDDDCQQCGGLLEGIPICSPDVLNEFSQEAVVIIMYSNSAVVKKRLQQRKNCKNRKIFSAEELCVE